MQRTYLFYDLETTGLNPAFDQVLQFAAIRTDEALNEIERHEINIKLRPDVIPSPYAVITHLMGPAEMQKGLNEAEGIIKIHALLNQPGTISVGYNTLGFDDEFLRFSFYRNLLTPYSHQYANQCARMDIFPMVIFYYLFNRDCLVWPENDGKVSLKLENVAKANNIFFGQAHNALVDVEMTVELAKKIKQNERVWKYCVEHFEKNIDMDRMQRWGLIDHNKNAVGLYIESALGFRQAFQAPVMYLGQHAHYKNQWLFLRLDLKELQSATLDNFLENTWVFRKKMGEPGFFLPLNEKYSAEMKEKRLLLCKENEKKLLAEPALLEKIKAHYLNHQYPIVPETDIDSALYQTGFLSFADGKLAKKFHLAHPNEKIKIAEQFSNTDLQTLAMRLIGRHYSNELPATEQASFLHAMKESAVDYRGQKKLTVEKALQEVEALPQERELTQGQKDVLGQYEAWLGVLLQRDTIAE